MAILIEAKLARLGYRSGEATGGLGPNSIRPRLNQGRERLIVAAGFLLVASIWGGVFYQTNTIMENVQHKALKQAEFTLAVARVKASYSRDFPEIMSEYWKKFEGEHPDEYYILDRNYKMGPWDRDYPR